MKKLKINNMLSLLFLIAPLAVSSAHHHSNESVKKESNNKNKKEIQVVKDKDSFIEEKQKESSKLPQNVGK
tara:strand:+ start:812 stop:1024 length:213 start_codon:yes stop_codon:yes gene_type:complete